MAIQIPITAELVSQNIANVEAKINQKTPLADRAFTRVFSVILALLETTLYKYAAERAVQCLALTATGQDLDAIGNQYDVTRRPAEAAELDINLTGVDTTVIPATTDFIGDPNGERYFPDSGGIISGGSVDLDVTAEDTGVGGNLSVSDTLTIGTQIPGADQTATVTAVLNLGVAEETDDDYRIRVLDKLRSQGGGANTADYRDWSQEVPGVQRAYPYSGSFPLPSDPPPARTVFVEADESIDPDGIAPQSLLDGVRENITTDPVTGIARQPLGLTDATLFVESIARTAFYVEIRNLIVDPGIEAQVKTDISTALGIYFRSLICFVDGLDVEAERKDFITDLTVSDVVQDVLSVNGASATGVGFGITAGLFLSSYTLDPGELAKLAAGGVSYV